MNTSLYNQVKTLLSDDLKGVISDQETILLNRKDYHLSQISPVNATLDLLNINIGYPYRVLISFLDQFASNIKDDFNIVLADPSLTLAAFYVWVRAGGGGTKGQVYAPRRVAKIAEKNHLIGELLDDFLKNTKSNPNSKPDDLRNNLFTFVIGNSKSSAQTIFAADRFCDAKKGLLVLKDYSKVDSFDEREYLEGKLIFPSITFEGHAFCLKI
jgi:hypothetical protein